MFKFFISLFIVSFVDAQLVSDATYTVIAPAKLRPNADYHVSISIHHGVRDVDVDVSISGLDQSSNQFNSLSKTVKVDGGETRIINFQIGEWGSGSYKLSVIGRGGLEFRNETLIGYQRKSYSVFIQTDKAIYKPGQLVHFRAVIVDPSLLPTVTGAIDVHIIDSKQNRVKQWKRLFSTKGVVSQEIQLSNNTLLGGWTIVVDILGQEYKKTFTVAEYVLPTFDVEIVLPAYATYNKSSINVKVKALYTYGKPVNGELTLTVQSRVRYNLVSTRPLDQYQVKSDINGVVDLPLDIVRDLNLKTDYFDREIEFFALVKETLTGKTYNKTAILLLHNNEIKIELVKTSKTFKPGLKYTIMLKCAYQDDTPVENNGEPLMLSYGYNYNDENYKNFFSLVPHNGIVKVDVYPPNLELNSISVLGMYINYRGQKFYPEAIEAAVSPSSNFIQITMSNEQELKVGKEIYLNINSTEPLKRLIYEVMGRGDIVLARSINIANKRETQITFTLTHSMAPKARVLVYYVREKNHEVVADSVTIDVDGVFRTPVQIITSAKQTKPRSSVDIQVNTKPNSFVGLLGIDQSILLLKSGNDITQKDVIDELETYNEGKQNKLPHWYGRRRKRSLWWTGSTTASEIFDDSGLVILSNGLVYQNLQFRKGKSIYNRPHPITSAPANDSIAFDEVLLEHRLRPPPTHLNLQHKSDSRIVLRKNFPETWLWLGSNAGRDGKAVFTSQVPDTITSWVITAFAVDSLTGLGIAPSPSKITVFRPFFVKLNLPHSIIRSEQVAIQVIVFNYFDRQVDAEVSLSSDGDFNFTLPSNEVDEIIEDRIRRKHITIPAQDGVSVTFLITTEKLGLISLEAKASTYGAVDAERRTLLVKAEGQTQYFNKAFLVDLRTPSTGAITKTLPVVIPKNAVKGSAQVSVSAIGDVIGVSAANLEDLLRMPYGCGEQNMLSFVPNIVILDYLTRSKKFTNVMKAKAIKNMEIGYQKELTYRRNDGSFSAFGSSDKAGSTWLTAFVLKSFQQARTYITIDDNVIMQAIQWLMERHMTGGVFDEPGEIHYKAMQGGSNSASPTLTAYVLIALLQNKTLVKPTYQTQLQLSETFLIRELRSSKSPYAIAIITYALHLLDSPAKDSAFEEMLKVASKADDLTWWSDAIKSDNKKSNTSDKQSSHFFLPASTDIEATSYGLLTLALRGDIDRSIPVMRWLVSQQNSNGGFSSTQDTAIGLQALGQLASLISTGTTSIDLKYRFVNSEERDAKIKINSENALTLQRTHLSPQSRIPSAIEIEASGFGTAIVQISWSYNLAVSAEEPAFFLNPLLSGRSNENFIQLNICTYYKAGNQTNMAVMEVELPTGFVADAEAVQSIRSQAKGVKRIETNNDETNVIIYFDRITRDELCLTVPAHRSFKVAKTKAVPVTLYDYYNRVQTARLFYEPPQSKTCDICDENDRDCRNCRNTTSNADLVNNTDENHSNSITSFNFLITVSYVMFVYVIFL